MGFNFVFPENLPEEFQGQTCSALEVGVFDESAQAESITKHLGLEEPLRGIKKVETYILVHSPQVTGLESLVRGTPFVDPIIHTGTLNESLTTRFDIPGDYVIHTTFKLGTSDEIGERAREEAWRALGIKYKPGDKGFHSTQYFIDADLSPAQLEEVAGILSNPNLNDNTVVTRAQFDAGHKITIPIVTLPPVREVIEYDIVSIRDEELLQLNEQRKLAATLEELKIFAEMYRDEAFLKKRREFGLSEKATDVELETYFGLRSEHCFHKEFNAIITLEDLADDPVFRRAYEKGWFTKDADGNYLLEDGMFKTFVQAPAKILYGKLEKRGKNWIISMFEDNSSVVAYDENYMFCFKIETHNSPSNKEPVQGAKTGIDGVNRDVFGTQRGTFDALANFFYYCTGDPAYKGWLPEGVKHPFVIQTGSTQGVREGGNEMQISTLNGGAVIDPPYIAKGLVYCGTVGWSPINSPSGESYIGKHPGVGDSAIVAGQAVGIDGVHGATESSLPADANISLGHVQADNSYVQARMKDFILNIARGNLLTSITDFGAMGLGSAAIETGSKTGGIFLELDKHPVKYRGIQPWQIVASETQNRMLLVVDPKNADEVMQRAELYDVEVTPVGHLTDSGYAHMTDNGKTVGLIDMKKLFSKEPRKRMNAVWRGVEDKGPLKVKGNYSLEESLGMVMSRPDVASREWFFRQKDSSVKGGTIQGPLIGYAQEVESDATLQKPLDTEGKDHGALAYAHGIAPKVSDIDPYLAAKKSVVDMVGKIIAIGGALPDMETAKWDAWNICGNYCQPNSDSKTTLTPESGEHNLASLWREGIGVREVEEALNIAVISGKDSMKCSCRYEVGGDFKLEEVPADLRRHVTLVEHKDGRREIEIHDPDTYLASAAVKIEDYRKCVNSAFKQAGDVIYVVGETGEHLGASQYAQAIGYHEQGAPLEGGEAPNVDLETFLKTCRAVHKAIDQELVASCRYIHDGGTLTAIAKSAMAGEKSAAISAQTLQKKAGINPLETALYSETPGRFIVSVAREDAAAFEEALGDTYRLQIGVVADNDEIHVYRDSNSPERINIDKIKERWQAPMRYDLDLPLGK